MRSLYHVAAVCLFLMASLVAADNAFIGTWKLNTAKSKGTPGTLTKEETVTFEVAGNQIKRTATGIDADGKPMDFSATIPWDGQYHKVPAPEGPAISVAVKFVNAHTINVSVKADDKVVSSGRVIVSRDGKTMTASFKGEDPKGRKFDNVEVFDRQ
jgi:hypothetical protein